MLGLLWFGLLIPAILAAAWLMLPRPWKERVRSDGKKFFSHAGEFLQTPAASSGDEKDKIQNARAIVRAIKLFREGETDQALFLMLGSEGMPRVDLASMDNRGVILSAVLEGHVDMETLRAEWAEAFPDAKTPADIQGLLQAFLDVHPQVLSTVAIGAEDAPRLAVRAALRAHMSSGGFQGGVEFLAENVFIEEAIRGELRDSPEWKKIPEGRILVRIPSENDRFFNKKTHRLVLSNLKAPRFPSLGSWDILGPDWKIYARGRGEGRLPDVYARQGTEVFSLADLFKFSGLLEKIKAAADLLRGQA